MTNHKHQDKRPNAQQTFPQPSPVTYAFQGVRVEDQDAIVFRLDGITGSFVTFWAPQALNVLGATCLKVAAPFLTGLTVAENPPLWKPGE